ncbi:MAG: hypothetical protein ABT940_12000 [Alphaproteobacteria bacterium]
MSGPIGKMLLAYGLTAAVSMAVAVMIRGMTLLIERFGGSGK